MDDPVKGFIEVREGHRTGISKVPSVENTAAQYAHSRQRHYRSWFRPRPFLTNLKHNKKFANATHNSWGLICGEQMIKKDDGEAGAGMMILRMLEREGLRDHVVVVTRWFGGKHLGGDRFRHVQEAVRIYIRAL